MKPSLEKPRQASTTRRSIWRPESGRLAPTQDVLAMEEPLEIRVRLAGARRERSLGMTMRTPGNDVELALGLLYAEGIIGSAKDVTKILHEPRAGDAQEFNSLRVDLANGVEPDLDRSARPFITSSACGVCGRASIDHLRTATPPRIRKGVPRVSPAVLAALPDRLRAAQTVFEATGGLHASGLFDADGNLIAIREDVGRHNAVDKLVGWALQERRLPLSESILLLSGRAGFEILQKATRAGIPFVAAVGAPSSLAVDVAEEFDRTLIGFLRGDRFNVYAGPQRVRA